MSKKSGAAALSRILTSLAAIAAVSVIFAAKATDAELLAAQNAAPSAIATLSRH